MRILVRKDVRAVGSNVLIGPILEVEKIELISYLRSNGEKIEYELFNLEDGSKRRPDELIFVEVDEALLVAMRLEASILAKEGRRK